MLANSYIFFSMLGIFSGASVFAILAHKANRSLKEIINLIAIAFVSSIVGAKIFHVLFEANGHALPNGDYADGVLDLLLADPWHWARFLSPGYVFYGGLLFALFFSGLFIFLKKMERPLLLADCAAPGIALGLAFGRIGCFFAGCCYGRELGNYGAPPVQLIESGFAFACFFFLMNKAPSWEGSKLWLFVTLYGVFRFFIEFWRDDFDRGLWFGELLSTSQVISILLLGTALWLGKRRLLNAYA